MRRTILATRLAAALLLPGRKVKVAVGTGKHDDGAGNETGETDSFNILTRLT